MKLLIHTFHTDCNFSIIAKQFKCYVFKLKSLILYIEKKVLVFVK